MPSLLCCWPSVCLRESQLNVPFHFRPRVSANLRFNAGTGLLWNAMFVITTYKVATNYNTAHVHIAYGYEMGYDTGFIRSVISQSTRWISPWGMINLTKTKWFCYMVNCCITITRLSILSQACHSQRKSWPLPWPSQLSLSMTHCPALEQSLHLFALFIYKSSHWIQNKNDAQATVFTKALLFLPNKDHLCDLSSHI